MIRALTLAAAILAAAPASAQALDPIGDLFYFLHPYPLPSAQPVQPARTVRRHRHPRTANKAAHGYENVATTVRASARSAGVPEPLAVAVSASESGNRCSPGSSRFKGPLQVSTAAAHSLGYRGNGSDLNTCGAGLFYGMKHLAVCFKLAHGNPVKAIRCHKRGFGSIAH